MGSRGLSSFYPGRLLLGRLAVHKAAGDVLHVVHPLPDRYTLAARLGASVARHPWQVVSDGRLRDGL